MPKMVFVAFAPPPRAAAVLAECDAPLLRITAAPKEEICFQKGKRSDSQGPLFKTASLWTSH